VGRLVAVKVYSTLTHVVNALATANFYNLPSTLKQGRTRLSQAQQLLNALIFNRQMTEPALSSLRVECSVRVGPSLDEAVAVARQAAIDVVGLLESWDLTLLHWHFWTLFIVCCYCCFFLYARCVHVSKCMKSFSYYIQTSVVVHVEALPTAYFFSWQINTHAVEICWNCVMCDVCSSVTKCKAIPQQLNSTEQPHIMQGYPNVSVDFVLVTRRATFLWGLARGNPLSTLQRSWTRYRRSTRCLSFAAATLAMS